ncbi:MAG: 2-amino-4-hydroxy-6-hydroxymethyldihydropteridine diphosphokinase [Elainella sp. C42_A2020_010]|nr:2-amino-4-hydroxy-6-hydroxymethyldihydropteridine diphosphokinase [Elainella sp. C42_A2020_010]RNJ70862.1 MAG: 2-amino-4-hydroxy-6-hydroxymethyldihydropteridine diphosphokinase [Leptolyngbya sp. IPPAS B-1204]
MPNSPDSQLPVHQAAVAMGSNLGDSYAILEAALKTLAHSPGIILQAQSPIYQTAAVGPPQPDYLNACALFSTTLEPTAFLETLLRTEAQFGRVRRERWGPRLLDLDLLLFDDLILQLPNLQIPHPRMTERAFVLVPLNNIAPDWIEPVSQKSIAQLVQQVDCSSVRVLSSKF